MAESDADSRPEHQLVAEKTDEVWQQAKPFVCDAFVLSAVVRWWGKPSGGGLPEACRGNVHGYR